MYEYSTSTPQSIWEDTNLQSKVAMESQVHEIVNLVSPFIESVYQVQEHVQRVMARAVCPQPFILVGVLGAPCSGKTTAINALLGDYILPSTDAPRGNDLMTSERIVDNSLNRSISNRPGSAPRVGGVRPGSASRSRPSSAKGKGEQATLPVIHIPGMQPTLVDTRTGQCLAKGAASVRNWLLDVRDAAANATISSTKSSSSTLYSTINCQLQTDICCMNGRAYAELPIHMVEFPAHTQLFKSHMSSISNSYRLLYSECCCDVCIFCIDYTLLKTPQESEIFHSLRSEANKLAVTNMGDRLFFLVTKADVLISYINKIINVHDNINEDPKFKSIEELRQYVSNMITSMFGFRPRDAQLSIASCKYALYAKIMKRRSGVASIEELYNFAELTRGSYFMQTIDMLNDDQLREQCRLHAIPIETESGVAGLEEAFQVIDANSGRMLLSSCIREVLHHVTQFTNILEQSVPTLSALQSYKQDELKILDVEYKEVSSRLQNAVQIILKMRGDMQSMYEVHFHEFWLKYVETILRAVMRNDESISLSSTQSVYDLQVQLGKFDKFLIRYLRDRKYLDERLQGQQPAAAAMEGHEAAAPIAGFITDNTAKIKAVLEQERRALVLDWCTAVAHQLKDELLVFLPKMEEELYQRRFQCVEKVKEELSSVFDRVKQSAMEEHEYLDIDSVGPDLISFTLLKYDLKTLNNIIREMPEYVTSIMDRLEVAADPVEQRESLCTIWLMFINQVSPYYFVNFEFNPFQKIINGTLQYIDSVVGRYVVKLSQAVEQVHAEMELNTLILAENAKQKFQVPQHKEILSDLLASIIARNLYSTAVAYAVKETAKFSSS